MEEILNYLFDRMPTSARIHFERCYPKYKRYWNVPLERLYYNRNRYDLIGGSEQFRYSMTEDETPQDKRYHEAIDKLVSILNGNGFVATERKQILHYGPVVISYLIEEDAEIARQKEHTKRHDFLKKRYIQLSEEVKALYKKLDHVDIMSKKLGVRPMGQEVLLSVYLEMKQRLMTAWWDQ